MFNLKTLKIGDEVGYARYYYDTLKSYGFSKIVKINAFGHIMLENGKSYDKHGTERKSPYSATYLYSPERLREQLAERDNRNQNRVKWNNLVKTVSSFEENSKYGLKMLLTSEYENLIALINDLRSE